MLAIFSVAAALFMADFMCAAPFPNHLLFLQRKLYCVIKVIVPEKIRLWNNALWAFQG
jgi:hypothetical protein